MTAEPRPLQAVRRLTRRTQFLNAARGQRAGRTGFSLQLVAVDEPDPGLGFTVTKKVGNSPERNRIRRRLRAAARACDAGFRPQHDYVLVGRREALTLPFDRIVADLDAALAKLNAAPSGTPTP